MISLDATSFNSDGRQDFAHVRLLRHHGTVIALAEAGKQLFVSVLNLAEQNRREEEEGEAPANASVAVQTWNHAQYWTSFRRLHLPDEVRLAGASLVTLPAQEFEAQEAGIWTCLSDGDDIYIFRCFTGKYGGAPEDGILYGNRFALVEVAASSDGETTHAADDDTTLTLAPRTEARFVGSGNADLARNEKDRFASVNKDGKPFIEPTLCFHDIMKPFNGYFAACLTPATSPGGKRWQFVHTCNIDQNLYLQADSFARLDNGWPDVMTVEERKANAGVFKVKSHGGNERPWGFWGQPDSLIYHPQLRIDTGGGELSQFVPGPARFFIAAHMGAPGATPKLTVFDLPLALDGDGRIDIPEKPSKDVPYTLELPALKPVRPEATLNTAMLSADLGYFDQLDNPGQPQLMKAADGAIHLYLGGPTSDAPGKMHALRYRTHAVVPTYSFKTDDPSQHMRLHPLMPPPTQPDKGETKHIPDPNYAILKEPSGETTHWQLTLQAPDRIETWYGLPGEAHDVAEILNGRACDDPLDPRVLAGELVYYGYGGAHECVLPSAAGNLPSLRLIQPLRGPLELRSVKLEPDRPPRKDTVTVTLVYSRQGDKNWKINAVFKNIPKDSKKAAHILRGIDKTYDYSTVIFTSIIRGGDPKALVVYVLPTDGGEIIFAIPQYISEDGYELEASGGGRDNSILVAFYNKKGRGRSFIDFEINDAATIEALINRGTKMLKTDHGGCELQDIFVLKATGGEISLPERVDNHYVDKSVNIFKTAKIEGKSMSLGSGPGQVPLSSFIAVIEHKFQHDIAVGSAITHHAQQRGCQTTFFGYGRWSGSDQNMGFAPKRDPEYCGPHPSRVCRASVKVDDISKPPARLKAAGEWQYRNQEYAIGEPGRTVAYPTWDDRTIVGALKVQSTANMQPSLRAPLTRDTRIGGHRDITLEAWANVQQWPNIPGVILAGQDTQGSYALAIDKNANKKRVRARLGQREYAATLPKDAQSGWTHLAAVWDRTSALRFDGKNFLRATGRDKAVPLSEAFRFDAILTWRNKGPEVQTLFSQGIPGQSKKVLQATLNRSSCQLKLGVACKDADDQSWELSIPVDKAIWISLGFVIVEANPIESNSKNEKSRGKKPKHEVGLCYFWGSCVGLDGESEQKERMPKAYSKAHQRLRRLTPDSSDRDVLEIGRDFEGEIASLRFWDGLSVGLEPPIKANNSDKVYAVSEKTQFATTPGTVPAPTHGFSFTEGSGRRTYDDEGAFELTLSSRDMWVKSTANARAALYCNGERLEEEPVDPKAHLQPIKYADIKNGALDSTEKAGQKNHPDYLGTVIGDNLDAWVKEVRIWQGRRTAQQILDGMYRCVTGQETQLAACWPMQWHGKKAKLQNVKGDCPLSPAAAMGEFQLWVSKEDFAKNSPPSGHDMPVALTPSFAPSGTEAKGTGAEPDGICLHAIEYGELQQDAAGAVTGALKRAYAMVTREGAKGPYRCRLITGMAVGDLDLRYLGQIETRPELIGYVEGAPPVPSENLTTPYYLSASSYQNYSGTSAITFADASETVRTLSSNRDLGRSFSLSGAGGASIGIDTGICAGLGLAVKTRVFKLDAKIGITGRFDAQDNMVRGAVGETGSGVNMSTRVEASGDWHSDPIFNPRYVPANIGYAVVMAQTANLFGLHLKETGTLVGMQIMPEPEIEPDFHLIVFPINHRYQKQGNLDGGVGGNVDPEFRNTPHDQRGYYRPKEAFELEARIARQEADLEARYRQYDKHALSESPQDALQVGPAERKAWEKARAKRNLVNTYVWTAAGGLYAVEEDTLIAREHSWGASTMMSGGGGFSSDLDFSPGIYLEAAIQAGVEMSTTIAKAKRESDDFKLSAEVTAEGFLAKFDRHAYAMMGKEEAEPPQLNKDPKTHLTNMGFGNISNPSRSVDQPGKVLAYRFKSFYLGPEREHFDSLFAQVIDPDWLRGDPSPEALLMRSAAIRPNRVWRVMHRVTSISRVAGDVDERADTAEPVPTPAVGERANRELLALIVGGLGQLADIPAAVKKAVEQHLVTSNHPLFTADARTRETIERNLLKYVNALGETRLRKIAMPTSKGGQARNG